MNDQKGCQEWLESISAYLDGALAPDEEQKVHAHLRSCPGCAEELVDLVPLVQTLRGLPPVLPTRDLWPDLQRELRSDLSFRHGARRRSAAAWAKPAMGAAAAITLTLVGGALTVFGARPTAPAVPVADLDTYWQQHDAFDRDQGLPTRYAPDLDAVAASYDVDD